MKIALFIVVSASLAIVTPSSALAEDGGSIASMDDLRFGPPKENGPAEPVEGKSGKAIRSRLDANSWRVPG